MCPCFTLRASDHLDDFVIEIGLVRLVRLVRLVPVSSAPSCQALLEAHLPSFSLANNRCLACLGTWNADSGYDSATSATLFCQVQSQHLPTMEATGQTWGGFVQISQHLENTGKSMRTICYIHQMPWAPRPSKIPGAKLAQKMNPLFVTGNLGYLSCKPVRNLYSTRTLPIPTDTLKRCFVVFLFSRICCNSRQELPKTIE